MKKERDYNLLFKEGNKAQLNKLKKHDNKDHWKIRTIEYLMNRIEDEHDELREALIIFYMKMDNDHVFNIENVINEAADIANFAHMIISNCNRLKILYNNKKKE